MKIISYPGRRRFGALRRKFQNRLNLLPRHAGWRRLRWLESAMSRRDTSEGIASPQRSGAATLHGPVPIYHRIYTPAEPQIINRHLLSGARFSLRTPACAFGT
jgi:hypothetical protein